MKLIRFISRTFIDVFGITHPSAENEDRAAWFIAFMLLAVLGAIAFFLILAFHYLHS